MLKVKPNQDHKIFFSTFNSKCLTNSLLIPALLVGAMLSGCVGGPTLQAKGAAEHEPDPDEVVVSSTETMDTEIIDDSKADAVEPAETYGAEDAQLSVEQLPSDDPASPTEESVGAIEDNTETPVLNAPPTVAEGKEQAEKVETTTAVAIVSKNENSLAVAPVPLAPPKASTAIVEPIAVEPEPTKEVATPAKVESAVSSAIGTRFGIWTLARGENGRCMLTTPTFQVKDGDFTSQFWLDIEQSRFIVNASLTLKSDSQKSGIKFDGGSLITFDEQEMPTRMVINQDVTKSIMNGSNLSVYLKSEELGETILAKDISLKNTSAAIGSLKSCK